MRIAFVQHGDYSDAYRRLRDGGAETYYGQRYSVDFVASLTRGADLVGTFALAAAEPHRIELDHGLFSAGAPMAQGRADLDALFETLSAWNPSHVVLRSPLSSVIEWCLERRVAVLPLFADSFFARGVRDRVRHWRLRRLLNRREIQIVGNHALPSSRSLADIGVAPEKIVPWDWPQTFRPEHFPVKRRPGRPLSIAYVGAVSVDKGAHDAVRAASILKQRGRDVRLLVAGDGEIDAAAAAAAECDVAEEVEFLGRIEHLDVIRMLAHADVSIVPSRHAYAEGMPKSLTEALATRTPVVVSDHPVFVQSVAGSPAARICRQSDAASYADAIAAVAETGRDYEAASEATAALWSDVVYGIEWGDLVARWLAEDDLADHSLAAADTPRRKAA